MRLQRAAELALLERCGTALPQVLRGTVDPLELLFPRDGPGAADIYEREVDDMVESLSSLMEPVIMVVLGGLIGGLVVAMYLPIFKLGQVV